MFEDGYSSAGLLAQCARPIDDAAHGLCLRLPARVGVVAEEDGWLESMAVLHSWSKRWPPRPRPLPLDIAARPPKLTTSPRCARRLAGLRIQRP